MMAHPWMLEWYDGAAEETWVIKRIEDVAT
jgi:hypothetical protein